MITDYLRPDPQVGKKFWLQWAVLTTLGFLIAGFGALGTGLGVGFAQWLLLRLYLNRAWWWIIVTAIGLTLGLIPMFIVGLGLVAGNAPLGPVAVTALIGGALAGLLSGLGQWLLIRNQARRAGWWILISTLSWMLWFTIILPGIISGVGLMQLLRPPADQAEPYDNRY